ncbi:MAG TPA: O-antigen ligase family protein [Candidatus Acidoferrales bacterium]|nr:O-antigen ligase family protein [Candidatus Acidoferrales bacterium]
MTSGKTIAATDICALVFGFFLGLCILKFGDPVILDQKISPPASLSEFVSQSWPPHWVNWIFFPLAAIVTIVAFSNVGRDGALRRPRPDSGRNISGKDAQTADIAPLNAARTAQRAVPTMVKGISLLPLLWLGWQFNSATRTVDPDLTVTTLWQFCGCAASFFIGALVFNTPRRFSLLLPGILAAFAICLVCAIRQRIEFPQDTKFLIEEQRMGWTNLPPQTVYEMKQDQTIITTNGVDIVNPGILAKFEKGRVMGTMVYPNALAQIILFLFPVAFVLVINHTRMLRPVVRGAAVAGSVTLAAVAFFCSGSKFGWLIAIVIGGVCLFRLSWPLKYKVAALALVAVLGIGVFAVRFHTYFARGATSAVARLDYWRAAVQTTVSRPAFGSGPGTFQRPYARLKSPDAEMARLAHNDYLEQFSDSGLPGGIFYCAWVLAVLALIGRCAWKSDDPVKFAIFLGLLGWSIQELGEFGLYIPASAWTAFMIFGSAFAMRNVETLRR